MVCSAIRIGLVSTIALSSCLPRDRAAIRPSVFQQPVDILAIRRPDLTLVLLWNARKTSVRKSYVVAGPFALGMLALTSQFLPLPACWVAVGMLSVLT